MKKKESHQKKYFKKNLKNFMKDESGNMTKENILKVGMGTLAALSMFSGPDGMKNANAAPQMCPNLTFEQWTHLSDNTLQWVGSDVGPKEIVPSHSHHISHCSY
jgi:hypothetical protein